MPGALSVQMICSSSIVKTANETEMAILLQEAASNIKFLVN